MISKVPEPNIAKLDAELARLTKRAEKLSVAPPVVTWGEWGEDVTYLDPLDPGAPATATRTSDRQVARVRRWRMVEVTGEAPRLAGWSFVAVVEHGDAELGNVVRDLPGESCPVEYRHAGPTCDHCQTVRRRSETFVVRHDDGRTARVGRQCLADFLGHKDPEALARAAEFLALLRATVDASEDEGWGGGYGGPARWAVDDVLRASIVSIGRDGWTSRAVARDTMRSATADRVACLLSPASDSEREARRELGEALDAATPEAELVATWARALGNGDRSMLSDYLHNVRVVLSGAVVEARHLGIAVSAVPTYRREQGQEMERRHAAAVSQHVGTVGKRAIFGPLTVLSLRELEGAYGVTHLYQFADASGNRLKWFASREPARVSIGDTVTLKATVKAHETYRGVAETVLTRAVVVEAPAQTEIAP